MSPIFIDVIRTFPLTSIEAEAGWRSERGYDLDLDFLCRRARFSMEKRLLMWELDMDEAGEDVKNWKKHQSKDRKERFRAPFCKVRLSPS